MCTIKNGEHAVFLLPCKHEDPPISNMGSDTPVSWWLVCGGEFCSLGENRRRLGKDEDEVEMMLSAADKSPHAAPALARLKCS